MAGQHEITFQIRNQNDEGGREHSLFSPKTSYQWITRRKEVEPEKCLVSIYEHASSRRRSSMPEVLIDFKDFAKGFQAQGNYEQRFKFYSLVFVCLCRVAREQETSVEVVDALMNDFFLGSTGSGSLKNLRSAVLWQTNQAARLRKEFKGQADELFVLYGPFVKKYLNISDTSTREFERTVKLPKLLEERSANAVEISDLSRASLDPRSYSMMFIAKLIGGRLVSRHQVNRALKTDLKAQEYEDILEAVETVLSRSVGPGAHCGLVTDTSQNGNFEQLLEGPSWNTGF